MLPSPMQFPAFVAPLSLFMLWGPQTLAGKITLAWHATTTLHLANCLTGTRAQLGHTSASTLVDSVRVLAPYGHHQNLFFCRERLGAPFFVALTEERKGEPPQES